MSHPLGKNKKSTAFLLGPALRPGRVMVLMCVSAYLFVPPKFNEDEVEDEDEDEDENDYDDEDQDENEDKDFSHVKWDLFQCEI